MKQNKEPVTVIGAGLAGCSSAWLLAERGYPVRLYEMRPKTMTPAHATDLCGELVCSNSLKSERHNTPQGLLKRELEITGSLIILAAQKTRVPAGQALAVDRNKFAEFITEKISSHPNISFIREELAAPPDDGYSIIATGPLTSGGMAGYLACICGNSSLYFYDAISPIVSADSIDMNFAFTASRYGKGGSDDYINCPLSKTEFIQFRDAMLSAEKVALHSFEEPRFFEGCLPIETIAERGDKALLFGPLKPTGLFDPHENRKPYCIVQLRAENRERTAFSLVACQTKMTYSEQERVFRSIPALRNAAFLRLGSVHRNTYVNAPSLLGKSLELLQKPNVRLAGQITGVEGYLESTAMGVWSALALIMELEKGAVTPPPETTAIGALLSYLQRGSPTSRDFTPMNVNFGIFPSPPLETRKNQRRELIYARGLTDFKNWFNSFG